MARVSPECPIPAVDRGLSEGFAGSFDIRSQELLALFAISYHFSL